VTKETKATEVMMEIMEPKATKGMSVKKEIMETTALRETKETEVTTELRAFQLKVIVAKLASEAQMAKWVLPDFQSREMLASEAQMVKGVLRVCRSKVMLANADLPEKLDPRVTKETQLLQ
jgi:hypothetical protein